jgi:hypothetical protein
MDISQKRVSLCTLRFSSLCRISHIAFLISDIDCCYIWLPSLGIHLFRLIAKRLNFHLRDLSVHRKETRVA